MKDLLSPGCLMAFAMAIPSFPFASIWPFCFLAFLVFSMMPCLLPKSFDLAGDCFLSHVCIDEGGLGGDMPKLLLDGPQVLFFGIHPSRRR